MWTSAVHPYGVRGRPMCKCKVSGWQYQFILSYSKPFTANRNNVSESVAQSIQSLSECSLSLVVQHEGCFPLAKVCANFVPGYLSACNHIRALTKLCTLTGHTVTRAEQQPTKDKNQHIDFLARQSGNKPSAPASPGVFPVTNRYICLYSQQYLDRCHLQCYR